MAIHYISFEVTLQTSMPEMVQAIEAEIQKWGVAVGWCVIDASPQDQTVTVVGAYQESFQ